MLKKIFIKRRAEGFIEIIFQFAIIMSLIFCFITLWKPFIYKQNIDYMAKTLVRAVESNGRIDNSITDLQNELKNELGVNPKIKWTATYIAGTNKIQIRKKFTLTLSDELALNLIEPSFSSPVVIKIPINKKFIGISQVYWK
jgi:hypothetical protein